MKAAESSLLNLKKYIRFMFSISDRAEVKVVKKPKRNIFERKKFQERKKKTNEKKLQKEQLKRLHQYYNAIKKTTTITNNLTIRMEAKKIHLKWNYLYGVCVCGTTPEILFILLFFQKTLLHLYVRLWHLFMFFHYRFSHSNSWFYQLAFITTFLFFGFMFPILKCFVYFLNIGTKNDWYCLFKLNSDGVSVYPPYWQICNLVKEISMWMNCINNQ